LACLVVNVGSLGKPGEPSTSRREQPHKQERHHTLTQNLKAMGLWVLLLIRCSTFTLLTDVRHITHTCIQQHSPSSVSPSIQHAPLQAEAFTLLVSSLLVSPQTDRHVCTAVVAFCANGPVASVAPFFEPGSDAITSFHF